MSIKFWWIIVREQHGKLEGHFFPGPQVGESCAQTEEVVAIKATKVARAKRQTIARGPPGVEMILQFYYDW